MFVFVTAMGGLGLGVIGVTYSDRSGNTNR